MKTRVELKLFERKLDFWNLFEKLESRRLLKNQSFEKWNLRIGILDIKFTRNLILEIKFERNQNFWKLNLKEIGIPEIKFEKDWSFKN